MKTLLILFVSLGMFTSTFAQEVLEASPVQSDKLEAGDDPVYTYVEQMPVFPGGDDALIKYISENIKYPAEAKEKDISGTVYVQFVVDASGAVTQPSVLRSPDPLLSQAALDVLKDMPNWKPGKQKGKVVPVKYTLPIRFALK